MKQIALISLAVLTLVLSSCGGGGSSSTPLPPPPPGGGGGSGGGTGGGSGNGELPTPPAAPQGSDFHPDNSGWVQVWSDEFDGNALDRTKWEVEESCWGGGNEERQCYTDRPENIEVVNGLLRLMAFPETFTGPQYPQGWPDGRGAQITKQYTSGKVRTREIADWTYGRFSARMKLPTGQGTWPAFWMMPSDNVYGTWAASGEIDIMESVNLGSTCGECEGSEGENRSSGAIHFGNEWPNNTFVSENNRIPGGNGAMNDYHVYAVEWGEGRINWFVDGEKFYTVDSESWFTSARSKDENPYAPFDQAFYLMFNLAVGGSYPENSNARGFNPDSFPSEVLVDWVRVYQCEFNGTSGRDCMDGETQ